MYPGQGCPGKGGQPTIPTVAFTRELLSHPVTMHLHLMQSALFFRMYIEDQGIGTTSYYHHQVCAIQKINKALDDSEERYSDIIIGAISILSINEVSSPTSSVNMVPFSLSQGAKDIYRL